VPRAAPPKGSLGGDVSRQPGSNCVSNETYVTIPVGSSPGEVWTFSVSYKAGNSLRTIYDQSHFRIVFY
jgi:hypothetical protein